MDIKNDSFKNCESLRTMCSLDTNISYISPLDNSLVTLNTNVRVKRKVSFNPQIEIIKVENLKHFNSRNNMSSKEIYDNLIKEKKRIKFNKSEIENEYRRNQSCIECILF
jgi:hypothetical protein